MNAKRKIFKLNSAKGQKNSEKNPCIDPTPKEIPVESLVTAWQSEIENLLGVKYKDLSAVLEAIADKSIAKLDILKEEHAEIKQFLIFYFENDPELLESIREIFFGD